MEQQTKVPGSEIRLAEWKVAKKAMSVLLVNGSRLYAEGLQLLLAQKSSQYDFSFQIARNIGPEEVVRLANSGELKQHLASEQFEMILLSTSHTSFAMTLEVAEYLRETWPDYPVLWLDMPDDPNKIVKCIRTGARGFILEHETPGAFCVALMRAAQGERVCPDRALPYLFEGLSQFNQGSNELDLRPLRPDLTPRELEVLNALVEGLSNRQIAAALNIELRTVKNHVHNILGKLQVTSRQEATILALQYSFSPKGSTRRG